MSKIDFTTPTLTDLKKSIGTTSAVIASATVLTGMFAIATGSNPAYLLSGAMLLFSNSTMNMGKRRIIACQREEVRKSRMTSLGFRHE